jgi:hypothetical protein
MHSQQPGGLIDRQLPIGTRFHVEMCYTGVSLIKEIMIALKCATGWSHLMSLVTSAD